MPSFESPHRTRLNDLDWVDGALIVFATAGLPLILAHGIGRRAGSVEERGNHELDIYPRDESDRA